MTLDSATTTVDAAIRDHRKSIVELLRSETPIKAALVLEQAGWSREWACQAIRKIEVEHNPGNLAWGPVENQKRRDRFSLEMTCGAALFVLSLIVAVLFLLMSRISLWTLGGAGAGLVLWTRAFPELKKYPDRRLPTYVPPKNLRGHQPGQY